MGPFLRGQRPLLRCAEPAFCRQQLLLRAARRTAGFEVVLLVIQDRLVAVTGGLGVLEGFVLRVAATLRGGDPSLAGPSFRRIHATGGRRLVQFALLTVGAFLLDVASLTCCSRSATA